MHKFSHLARKFVSAWVFLPTAALCLVGLLAATSARAANVMYSPFTNLDNNQREIFYLTDQHASYCKGHWRVAHIETDTGKPIHFTPMCWWFAQFNNRSYMILNANTGDVQTGGGFRLVPGSAPQLTALASEHQDQLIEFYNPSQEPESHPHP